MNKQKGVLFMKHRVKLSCSSLPTQSLEMKMSHNLTVTKL